MRNRTAGSTGQMNLGRHTQAPRAQQCLKWHVVIPGGPWCLHVEAKYPTVPRAYDHSCKRARNRSTCSHSHLTSVWAYRAVALCLIGMLCAGQTSTKSFIVPEVPSSALSVATLGITLFKHGHSHLVQQALA